MRIRAVTAIQGIVEPAPSARKRLVAGRLLDGIEIAVTDTVWERPGVICPYRPGVPHR